LLSTIKLFNTCTYVREASFDLIYLIFVNYLSYTPISDPEAKGYFDLLIKVYPDGKMSQHFASLKPGDVLEVKGYSFFLLLLVFYLQLVIALYFIWCLTLSFRIDPLKSSNTRRI